jgi:hypothetical protein
VITRTAIGDCRVRATAAATANYYSAYKETTFSFSTAVAPVVTPSSSPSPSPSSSPSPSLSNSPSSSPSNSPSVAVALADTGTSNPYLPFFLAALLLPLGVSLLMFAETKSRRKRFLRN